MKTINREVILRVAEQLIEERGVEKTTLTQVAKHLGVSHAALYKYFKNKEDLWTTVATNWLNRVLISVFQFNPKGYTSKIDILHDWLWEITLCKKQAFDSNKRMFTLYTTYISENPVLEEKHIKELLEKMSSLLSYPEKDELLIILEIFAIFLAPAFAKTWGNNLQVRFEMTWEFIQPCLARLI